MPPPSSPENKHLGPNWAISASPCEKQRSSSPADRILPGLPAVLRLPKPKLLPAAINQVEAARRSADEETRAIPIIVPGHSTSAAQVVERYEWKPQSPARPGQHAHRGSRALRQERTRYCCWHSRACLKGEIFVKRARWRWTMATVQPNPPGAAAARIVTSFAAALRLGRSLRDRPVQNAVFHGQGNLNQYGERKGYAAWRARQGQNSRANTSYRFRGAPNTQGGAKGTSRLPMG